MPSTFSFIASYTVTSTTASFSFTSIPSTYDDLTLLIKGRTALTGFKFGRAQIQLNGSTSNYSGIEWYAFNTTSATVNMDNATIPNIAIDCDGNTASMFAPVVCNITNYKQTSYHKQINMFSVVPQNDTTKGNDFVTIKWNDTSAVTSITIKDGDSPTPSSGFVAGTTAYLYGIKRT